MSMLFREQVSWRMVGFGAVVVSVLLTASDGVATAQTATGQVTFAKHILPILQDKCQVCHRPGAMGPMSLLTYEQVRPWARAIGQKVASREMPPWYIDKTIGIRKFKNDRSLTDEQVDTIVRWVETGAAFGDPRDLVAPKQWPDEDSWQLRELFGAPDVVVTSDPWTMPAAGQDKWWDSTVDTGLMEDRWVRAIEQKPSRVGRKVIHHAVVFTVDRAAVPGGETRLFNEWAVGKAGEVYQERTGQLLRAGSKIRFRIHYHASGEEAADTTVALGLYFYPKGYVPQFKVNPVSFDGGESYFDIPPGQTTVHHGYTVLRNNARLESFQPHMHLRGKAMAMEAIYPDGRIEVMSAVSRFSFNWHMNYTYADDVAPLLPKGTIIHITSWHDNTSTNRANPDPTQWVGYGERSIDDMAHAWVNVIYLTEEDYAREVSERRIFREGAK